MANTPTGLARASGSDRERHPVADRINGERIVVIGWTRAMLLQFAHPLIAAGIHEHSGFRVSSWAAVRRLHLTLHAMLALTFGDEAGQARALDGVRTIHRRVNGRLPAAVGPFAAGTPYSAEDPRLVTWVHATLLESMPLTYDLLVAPVAPSERDVYCREAAPLALALGADDADVPRSAHETRAYMDAMYASGEITVGLQARELAAALLAPIFGVAGVPFARVNRLLAVGLLPPALRRQYGFAWTSADERALARGVMALRALRRLLPDTLARWPAARR